MIKLVKALGSEAVHDPSLLHPLFARLPPLYPDTPSALSPPHTTAPMAMCDDDVNPYAPIRLSEVFALSNRLLAKFPWDGKLVRGREVMGPGSVALTYPDDLATAEAWIDRDVVLPGADRLEDDDVPAASRRFASLRVPPNKVGTALAVGVLVLGLGLAAAGAKDDGWRRWWVGVMRGWAGRGKLGDALGEWARMGRYLVQSLRELV
ncbi:GTPase-activating protein gyp8 [Cryptotrichosporon argae]